VRFVHPGNLGYGVRHAIWQIWAIALDVAVSVLAVAAGLIFLTTG
jgi:hypothetical protein